MFCWLVCLLFFVLGQELVTRVASLWQVPALLSHPGAGTCHTGGFVVTIFALLSLYCDFVVTSSRSLSPLGAGTCHRGGFVVTSSCPLFAPRVGTCHTGGFVVTSFHTLIVPQGGNLSHGRLRCDDRETILREKRNAFGFGYVLSWLYLFVWFCSILDSFSDIFVLCCFGHFFLLVR